HVNDIIEVIKLIKHKGIDFINVSSGGVVPTKIDAYTGYQLDFASKIRKETNIPVIGGGLITTASQANDALKNLELDFIFFGRKLLRNPHFTYYAAKELGVLEEYNMHSSYKRAKETG